MTWRYTTVCDWSTKFISSFTTTIQLLGALGTLQSASIAWLKTSKQQDATEMKGTAHSSGLSQKLVEQQSSHFETKVNQTDVKTCEGFCCSFFFSVNDHVGLGFLKCVDNVWAVWFHSPNSYQWPAMPKKDVLTARSLGYLWWQFFCFVFLRFDQLKKACSRPESMFGAELLSDQLFYFHRFGCSKSK